MRARVCVCARKCTRACVCVCIHGVCGVCVGACMCVDEMCLATSCRWQFLRLWVHLTLESQRFCVMNLDACVMPPERWMR